MSIEATKLLCIHAHVAQLCSVAMTAESILHDFTYTATGIAALSIVTGACAIEDITLNLETTCRGIFWACYMEQCIDVHEVMHAMLMHGLDVELNLCCTLRGLSSKH